MFGYSGLLGSISGCFKLDEVHGKRKFVMMHDIYRWKIVETAWEMHPELVVFSRHAELRSLTTLGSFKHIQ